MQLWDDLCCSASDFIFCHLQDSKDTKKTIDGKHRFQGFSQQHNVTIKAYCTNNYIRNSSLFRQNCSAAGQGLLFSGANAHHQNDVIERKIGYITNLD